MANDTKPNPSQQPVSDGSGSGTGGKNVVGHSLSHQGHQASEDDGPSDATGSGTGGKNEPGKTLSGPNPQGQKPPTP